MLTELSVSLFSILLLPFLPTFSSCTFHFFEPIFVISCRILWQTNFLLFHCYIRRRSYPRVYSNFRSSHHFQFGSARAAFPFYYYSSLQLFGLLFLVSESKPYRVSRKIATTVGNRTRDHRVSRTALYQLSYMLKLGTIEMLSVFKWHHQKQMPPSNATQANWLFNLWCSCNHEIDHEVVLTVICWVKECS